MAMADAEILRRHAFYQTSYTGPQKERVVRSALSPERLRIPSQPRCRRKKQKKHMNVKGSTNTSNKKTTRVQTFGAAPRTLDYRRQCRSNRIRPWREDTPTIPSKSDKVQLFYEGALPKNLDKNQITLKARTYVSNTKYGNIYEIREENTKAKSKPTLRSRTPPSSTYLWEEDYLLWMKGTRDRYLEELTSRSRISGTTNSSSINFNPRPEPLKTRPTSLPSIREKADRPSAEVYAYYNSYRLEKSRRKSAAISIQRLFRGWYIRHYIKKLKRKALFDHDKTWPKFIQDYKEIIARIQTRYGIMKPSCCLDLKQINTFMDKKLRYEAMFRKLAVEDKLPKDDLLEFFNLCDLWPTKYEINRSYDAVFRGSGNTAEVVFLLDCSTCLDIVGFHNVIKFVRDVVLGLDIAPDRTRVGFVPYNEDVFGSFGINDYKNKMDVLEAISKTKVRLGLSRTDLALHVMLQMFMDSRPGVQKIGIVITDGKSTDPGRTEEEAKQVHKAGVEVFVIGIGSKADEKEMTVIASSPEHIFTAADPRSLSYIKYKIEKRFRLAACSFCQYLLPRIARFGLLLPEALDILWSTYPPAAANIGVEKYLSVKILDDKILKATNIKACIRLVIQSKLERHGYITVPSDVREGIEKVTNEDQALEIVQNFMNTRSK